MTNFCPVLDLVWPDQAVQLFFDESVDGLKDVELINERVGNVVGDLERHEYAVSDLPLMFRLSSAKADKNPGDLIVNLRVLVPLPRKELIYVGEKIVHQLIRQSHRKAVEQFVGLSPHLCSK